MLNKTTSFYKNNLNAKRSRQFLGALANVGIIYVLSVLLFTLCFRLIGDNLPNVKKTINEVTKLQNDFYDERKNAGLMVFDEDGLLDEGTVIRSAIKNETKTALLHYNLQEKYQNFDTYKDSKIIDLEHLNNNPVIYYFCSYKVENPTYYPNNPAKSDYFIDYYENILENKSDLIVYEANLKNELRYFTKDVTLILADYYFAQDRYPDSVELNKEIYKIFTDTYFKGLSDFDENNQKGASLLDAYEMKHSKYANSLIVELFLSYLTACFITYFVVYFVNKNYCSVGDAILKTPIVTSLGNRINIFHELGIFSINFISNIHILFFVILTIYNNPGLSVHYFGFMNIAILSIFAVAFSVITLLMMLFMKNHQYLDASSMLLTRKNRDQIKVEEDGTNKSNE